MRCFIRSAHRRARRPAGHRLADSRTLPDDAAPMHTRTAIAAAVVLCSLAAAQRGERSMRELELRHFTYKVESFEAPSLERKEGQYAIYLPADYDAEDQAETTYPVAIWLHGMRGSLHRFHDNGGPQILDELRAKDSIPPLIFVAVSASRTPLYLDGLPDGDWETAIAKDLVAHLEATYRVAKDRTKRALMGVSIGGMGALRIGLRHPGTFGVLAAHSAVVPPADVDQIDERMMSFIRGGRRRGPGLAELLGDPVDPEKWKLVSPLALARDLEEQTLKSTWLYFDAGTDDRYGLAPGNEALHALLVEREIAHGFELVDGGGHAWGTGSTQRQLPKSLAFVAARFEGKEMPGVEATADDAEPEPVEAMDGK